MTQACELDREIMALPRQGTDRYQVEALVAPDDNPAQVALKRLEEDLMRLRPGTAVDRHEIEAL